MTYVYRLIHRKKVYFNPDFGWVCDDKGIGCFSTFSRADRAGKEYRKIIGFRDFPDNFMIEKIPVFGTKKNCSAVYELTHFFDDGYGNDIVPYSGFFSSRKKARCMISLLKKDPFFSSRPEDFLIVHIKLNQCSWREGFISVGDENDIL